MKQLDEYNTCNGLGKDGILPRGYNKIKVHLIYDIKHDTRYKTRCVAEVNLTEVPTDSVYSGVVSLFGLYLMVFLDEPNKLDTWAIVIGNIYLEAKTSEQVYITAGQEFGEKQRNTLIIYKSLYSF